MDGFITTEFPATMAATAYAIGDAIGELCADMTAQTPNGLPLYDAASESMSSKAAMRESTSDRAS